MFILPVFLFRIKCFDSLEHNFSLWKANTWKRNIRSQLKYFCTCKLFFSTISVQIINWVKAFLFSVNSVSIVNYLSLMKCLFLWKSFYQKLNITDFSIRKINKRNMENLNEQFVLHWIFQICLMNPVIRF